MTIDIIKKEDYEDIWNLILEDFDIISQDHRKYSSFYIVSKYIINEEFFPDHPELWGDWISDSWLFDVEDGSSIDEPTILYRAKEVDKTVIIKEWVKVAKDISNGK
mgnify:CR=1 FL=1